MIAQRAFHADVPYAFIQSVRLVHALMETGHRVHVRPEHRDRFARLEEVFGISYELGVDDVPQLPAIVIDHSLPQTSIGNIRRPLIFPDAIVRRCRELWVTPRPVRFSFAGLVTDSRRQVLGDWLTTVDPDAPRKFSAYSDHTSFARSLVSAPRRFLERWWPRTMNVDTGDVVFWSSERGRQFPGKSWDEEYYKLLSRSQFVLCPNGYFIWTYRFFEAALCGALPVIEDTCDAYAGFRYRTMNDNAADLEWSREDAEHNYARCRDLLTVPRDTLSDEIATLLSPAASRGAATIGASSGTR